MPLHAREMGRLSNVLMRTFCTPRLVKPHLVEFWQNCFLKWNPRTKNEKEHFHFHRLHSVTFARHKTGTVVFSNNGDKRPMARTLGYVSSRQHVDQLYKKQSKHRMLCINSFRDVPRTIHCKEQVLWQVELSRTTGKDWLAESRMTHRLRVITFMFSSMPRRCCPF